MEEGGERDPLIPPDEDDAANDENTTQPFQPDDHSTPEPSGEEVPMTTFSRDRAKGPESAETSFTEGRTHSQVLDLNEKAWESLTGIFPEAKASGLKAFFSKTGKLQVKKLGFGKKAYPLFTFEKRTGEQRLNPKLTKEIKDTLGPEREVLISQKDKETHSYRNPFEKMR